MLLFFFKGYLYAALILEFKTVKPTKNHETINEYRIHYNVWSKSWDEWVTPERIFKVTPINEEIREKLQLFCQTRNKAIKPKILEESMAKHEVCRTENTKNYKIVAKGKTKWISCTCNRWFHKTCIGYSNFDGDFYCSKVDLEYLPIKTLGPNGEDVKIENNLIMEMVKSESKLHSDSTKQMKRKKSNSIEAKANKSEKIHENIGPWRDHLNSTLTLMGNKGIKHWGSFMKG